MNRQKLIIRDEWIKLGQVLKLADLVDSGAEAKLVIRDGRVTVNGEVEYQRGRKLHNGDLVEFEGSQINIVTQGQSITPPQAAGHGT